MKLSDFGKLPTEQRNPRSRHIDKLPVSEILNIISREDESIPKIVRQVHPQIAKGVSLIVQSLKNGGRLFFAGAGTSGRLGVLEAAECPPTFNTPPSLVQAVMAGGRKAVFRSQEGAEDREEESYRIFMKKIRAHDIVVGIAASGVTPFVKGAFKAAAQKKIKTILVSCNPSAAIAAQVDCVIAPKTGPEVITGSTRLKAGTATKLVLNRLTVASMIQMGKVYQNWMVDLQPRSKKLKARALRLICHLGKTNSTQAEELLGQAHNRVKTAILMARTGLDRNKAEKLLEKQAGFLSRCLGSAS